MKRVKDFQPVDRCAITNITGRWGLIHSDPSFQFVCTRDLFGRHRTHR